nr:hypothetical protein [Pandoravirus massiliensis]
MAVAANVRDHATQSMPPPLHLTDLPSEIAALITDAMDNPRDYCACILTCRWFRVSPSPMRLARLFTASGNVESLLACAHSTGAVEASVAIIKSMGRRNPPRADGIFIDAARRGRVDILDRIWKYRRSLLSMNHKSNRSCNQMRCHVSARTVDDNCTWPSFDDGFGYACLEGHRESVDWFLRQDVDRPRLAYDGAYRLASCGGTPAPFLPHLCIFAQLHTILHAAHPDGVPCQFLADRARYY